MEKVVASHGGYSTSSPWGGASGWLASCRKGGGTMEGVATACLVGTEEAGSGEAPWMGLLPALSSCVVEKMSRGNWKVEAAVEFSGKERKWRKRKES